MSSIRFRVVAAVLASVAVLALACGSEDLITPTPGGPGPATPVGGQPGIISGYDAVYFSLRAPFPAPKCSSSPRLRGFRGGCSLMGV